MRILICSNACPPNFIGGAELMACEQAEALALLGHDVRVFAGDLGSPYPRHQRTDDLYKNIRFHRIATVPTDYSPEYLNFLHPQIDAHFRDVLQDFRPEIVHCHNLTGLSVKLPVIAGQFGAKVVCTLHDFWGFCLRNTAVRPNGTACDDVTQCRLCLPQLHDGQRLHVPLRFRKDFVRLALDHVDCFIAPSRHVARRYCWAGFPADRITVVPNGIDIERFRPSSAPEKSGEFRITYVGYLGSHKGVSTLLDAFARLHDRAVTLQLAGEGPEESAYRYQIEALGLAGRVHFLGKVQPAAMPTVYATSDLVVLPSVWDENQPVCLMEAMAAGLPVVASRKGGIPEIVEHGENGLLFAAGDTNDLVAQLLRLIDDPDLRRAAGRKGRQRVEGLSHTHQAGRLLEVYAEMLDQPAAARSYDVYGAIGDMHRKLADEAEILADHKQPNRHFIPPDWIADCLPAFKGAVLMQRVWHLLRFLRITPIIPFPGPLRKTGNALLHRMARKSH